MDTPKSYDEQKYPDIVRGEREQEGKDHDSGECDPNWKTCIHAKKMVDSNGHFDGEVLCVFKNNEPGFCGVPCPLTKEG